MTTVSIRLSEELLDDIDKLSKKLRLPRAEYIRRAIESMNEEVLEEQRRLRLVKVSHRVRKHSMDVNAEFNKIEHDPRA